MTSEEKLAEIFKFINSRCFDKGHIWGLHTTWEVKGVTITNETVETRCEVCKMLKSDLGRGA